MHNATNQGRGRGQSQDLNVGAGASQTLGQQGYKRAVLQKMEVPELQDLVAQLEKQEASLTKQLDHT